MGRLNKDLSIEERKLLKSVFLRSHLVFNAFTMTKMEANGFTLTMQPALESIYKDDPEGKKEAYARHQNFFNTHAVPFAFIAGLTVAMEKEHKEKGSVPGETIDSVKAALMGPTAGMFDSLFFNCMRIIAAGIAIGLCSTGNAIGVPLFILLYGATQSIIKYIFVHLGYTLGTSFIDKIYNSGLMNSMTKSASILGLMMVGAMSATLVNVPLTWTININQASVDILGVLNSIFPGILNIALVFFLMFLIKKKHIRPTYIILGVMVFGLLGAAIHIF